MPDSVHLAAFPEGRGGASQDDPVVVADFGVLLAWRERVTKALEPFRAQKNKSVDARVTLHATTGERQTLAKYESELADLFIVSAVSFGDRTDNSVEVAAHPGPRCERCWKHYAKLAADPPDVCDRCAAAVKGTK